jgi:hypothetical protein
MKRTQPLESHMYGDPMRVLEAKQAREANAAKRAEKRPTLHVRKEWSEARKAAEALFDFPAAPRSEA